jgi:hypothetical protein
MRWLLYSLSWSSSSNFHEKVELDIRNAIQQIDSDFKKLNSTSDEINAILEHPAYASPMSQTTDLNDSNDTTTRTNTTTKTATKTATFLAEGDEEYVKKLNEHPAYLPMSHESNDRSDNYDYTTATTATTTTTTTLPQGEEKTSASTSPRLLLTSRLQDGNIKKSLPLPSIKNDGAKDDSSRPSKLAIDSIAAQPTTSSLKRNQSMPYSSSSSTHRSSSTSASTISQKPQKSTKKGKAKRFLAIIILLFFLASAYFVFKYYDGKTLLSVKLSPSLSLSL